MCRKPISIQSTAEIQTQHSFLITAWHGQDQQYAYPFDGYTLTTYFQALSPKTNVSLPTLFVRIIDATSNFQPSLYIDAQLWSPLTANGSTNIAYGIHYYFHRITLSRVFVMLLWIVNWVLTAFVVYITVSELSGLPMSESVLILPLSVILTIPALRALWVDAPAFGLLLGESPHAARAQAADLPGRTDSCGTFVQFVVVAISSVYLVLRVSRRGKPDAPAELQEKQETIAATELAELAKDA